MRVCWTAIRRLQTAPGYLGRKGCPSCTFRKGCVYGLPCHTECAENAGSRRSTVEWRYHLHTRTERVCSLSRQACAKVWPYLRTVATLVIDTHVRKVERT